MSDVLYRFDSHNVSNGVDMFDDPLPGHTVVINIEKHVVIRRTPKGAWISSFSHYKGERFILLTARKQFASNTIKEAKNQFIFRKRKYIQILNSKIDDTEISLRKVEDCI